MSGPRLTIDQSRGDDSVGFRQSSHSRDLNLARGELERASTVSPLLSNARADTDNNNSVALTSVVSRVDDLDSKPRKSKDFEEEAMENKTATDVESLQARKVTAKVVGLDSTDRAKTKAPVNYAAKKRVAQGMIDIALLTSNASQLRNLVESQARPWTYVITLGLIITSILLQVAVGVMLIFKGHYDAKAKRRADYQRTMNNSVMAAVFLITIINIFIASFSPVRDPLPASTSPI